MRLRTTSLRSVLRSGASLAALAAAWGLPQLAEAQTCSTGAVLDGVPAGTLVACPSGTQLDFPGAVVVGPFTVPNGSVLTGTLNGTSPTHRQFAYNDPNGNALTVFLQGFYDLRGGVGGATELQGPAILGLSGAGACGAGAQVCPGGPGAGVFGVVNDSTFGGGGVSGGFALPGTLDPYAADTGPTSFLQVSLTDLSGTACGGAPQSCGSADALVNDLLEFFSGPDPVAAEAYNDCRGSGGSCAYVLVPEGDHGSFHYGPVVNALAPSSVGTFGSDNDVTISGLGFSDFIFTDASGISVFISNASAVDVDRIAGLLRTHESNTAVLSQNNDSSAGGAGVQGTFSIPGVDDRFIYSGLAGGDGTSYVVSFPLSSGDAGGYRCDPGGCDFLYAREADPYEEEVRREADPNYNVEDHILPEEIRNYGIVPESIRYSYDEDASKKAQPSLILPEEMRNFGNIRDEELINAFVKGGEGQNLAEALLLLIGDRTSTAPAR